MKSSELPERSAPTERCRRSGRAVGSETPSPPRAPTPQTASLLSWMEPDDDRRVAGGRGELSFLIVEIDNLDSGKRRLTILARSAGTRRIGGSVTMPDSAKSLRWMSTRHQLVVRGRCGLGSHGTATHYYCPEHVPDAVLTVVDRDSAG